MLNEKMKKYLQISAYLVMVISLLIPDYLLKRWIYSIGFVGLYELAPYLFTFGWIFVFVTFVLLLPEKYGKIFYSIITVFWYLLASAQYLYFKIFGKMIWVKDVVVAKEGTGFIQYVIDNFDFKVFFLLLCCFLSVLYVCLFYKKMFNLKKGSIAILTVSAITIGFTPSMYGEVGQLNWDSWKNRRYVYESFSDQNKCMQLSGLYQFTIRDLYHTFFKSKIENKKTYERLDEYYENKQEFSSNDYTGLFEGKNIIVVMMESMDDWTITEKSTPALYYMMENGGGINFDNFFAPIFGAGATFNSEFTLNTGFHSPNSGNAAYAYNKNMFPYSLAHVFSQNGYEVNSFHYNTGSFYNRSMMHEAFGYNQHYSFLDLGYTENEAIFDSVLLEDEELYDKFMHNKKPFLNFFVTYSNHLQYNLQNEICKVNAAKYPSIWDNNLDEEMNCLNVQTKETDVFFQDLLIKLNEEGILDDTVIVAFTDHKLYGMQQDVSHLNKEAKYNLEDNVPFFIYDHSLNKNINVEKVVNTTDILPTILNLFGYTPSKYYLGNDAFDPNYQGYTFFANYNWYDGEIYNDGTLDYVNDKIKEMNQLVLERIEINNMVLESNYFSYLESKK